MALDINIRRQKFQHKNAAPQPPAPALIHSLFHSSVIIEQNEKSLLVYDSLFDVQVKRIHEYKRQMLNVLHLIVLYQEMLADPHHTRIPRTVIIAGKAAAGYEVAKDIIRLAYCVSRKIN
ncbi:MAG: glycogen/starch/alpha-glucan phosphorylase, partial [Anaerolineaceae bacterium]|nr:glycogen/starch/alpha-glucan phosphorylase [Anaerolineaceae bacterium]